MLSKFSGSRQDQQFVLLLGILLGVLGISLFLAVSMGSVAIDLGAVSYTHLTLPTNREV